MCCEDGDWRGAFQARQPIRRQARVRLHARGDHGHGGILGVRAPTLRASRRGAVLRGAPGRARRERDAVAVLRLARAGRRVRTGRGPAPHAFGPLPGRHNYTFG